MSKKINLTVPGVSRSNLWSAFRQYLIRKEKEEREYWSTIGRRLGGRFNYLLYDDDDDYRAEMEKLREYYGCDEDVYPGYDDEDEYYVDDDGSIVFPINNRKGSEDVEYSSYGARKNSKGKNKHIKHRSRRGGKKAKIIDIDTPYSGFEDDPDEVVGTGKIYYYPDYHDKYERLEFDSLLEFDQYCQEEGFCVPPYVGEKLAYRPVSHCCLNPFAKERGVLEIMAEESYGDMHYEACDESELGG